jgi:hypothetical protein
MYAKDIPETYELKCELDISMPTDERQNVVMATQATFGNNPLVPMKYARERWLKVTNPDEMQEEIWAEQIANLQVQSKLQQQMAMPSEAASQLQGAQNTSVPAIGVPGVPMNNEVDIQNPLPSSGQPPQGGQTPGRVGANG